MPGSTSRFAILLTQASGATEERELAEGELTIGRADTSDIGLFDSQVSRTHARLRISGDSAVIDDAGSSNGTYVNGERTNSAELRPGDRITMGNSALQLIERGGQAVSDATEVSIAVSSDGTVVLQNLVVVDPQSTQVLAPAPPLAPSRPECEAAG